MKRNLILFLMLAAILLLLVACGSAQTIETEPTQAENAEAQASGNNDTASIVEDTSAQEVSPYYTILLDAADGEKHEFDYIQNLYKNNRLKFDSFMETERKIEIVGPLDKIGGATTFSSVGNTKVDSYIVLGNSDVTTVPKWWLFGNNSYTIDTTGMEDVIMEWEHGDTIRVTGIIYSNTYGNLVYLFADEGEITIENLSR